MLLPDDLAQRPRPQAIGKRRIRGWLVGRLGRDFLVSKQVGHRAPT
jgi:hypothetical protein